LQLRCKCRRTSSSAAILTVNSPLSNFIPLARLTITS
jgi:hypothetical protein